MVALIVWSLGFLVVMSRILFLVRAQNQTLALPPRVKGRDAG